MLTAVDAALMVIDAGNGVEPQTRRLLQVCRARNTPILTFVNKMDREVQAPLDLMDEIERELGMTVVPFTWPVGMGKTFRGVFDRRTDQMRVFAAGEDRRGGDEDVLVGLNNPESVKRFGSEFEQAQRRTGTGRRRFARVRRSAIPGRQADPHAVRLGGEQLRRARGARRAGGPGAAARATAPRSSAWCTPKKPKFSGVVFKIQANMDPAHRDRIAFVRVASGHFERGMKLKVVRSGKDLRPNTVVSFLSQRRELLDEAFAGDIIGIPNHGVLQLGDTLTEGESLQFTGLPFFAPEIIRSVEVADPLRSKQLRAGLTQLGEEGAIQVFRPVAGSVLLLGAVGQLQFEVVAHRLEHEYGVKARIMNSPYQVARWVTCAPEDGGEIELKKFIDANSHRVALDAVDAPTLLVDHAATLRAVEANWPKIKFHAMREHAGLVFHKTGFERAPALTPALSPSGGNASGPASRFHRVQARTALHSASLADSDHLCLAGVRPLADR